MLNELRHDIAKLLEDTDNKTSSSLETLASVMYEIAIRHCLKIVDDYIYIYGDDGK